MLKLAFALVFLNFSFAFAADKFYANQDIQDQALGAFALQSQAKEFVVGLDDFTKKDREVLANELLVEPTLSMAFTNWTGLTIDEQIPFLKKVFEIEVRIMGIQAPELVFSETLIQGPAYFDFDVGHPSAGKVILNPKALENQPNKFTSLALLIHETRHSAQLQLAFSDPNSVFGKGYRLAFQAQKNLQGKLSFCDFLTLLNEYEAFQFGNYVLGRLTFWTLEMPGMGTFASQYDVNGNLKIDLRELHQSGADNILPIFNELEKEQYQQLHP